MMEIAAAKKKFVAAVTGTVLVALFCFTPILVLLLSAIGLGALTDTLDRAGHPGP